MPQPIYYVDRSRILDGHVGDVQALIPDLTSFVEANEPQLTAYGFFVDSPGSTMTVVAVHPDSSSLLMHMDIGRERFRAFAPFIELVSIDVYGDADAQVVDRLRAKAEMLGGGSVTVHSPVAVFDRTA